MSPVPAMLAPSDVERLIDRLPAEQRARFRWAPERFRQIFDRLLDGEVTPEVIHQATAEFVRVCVPLIGDLLATQPALPEGISEARSDLSQSREDKLMAYFQGLSAAAGIEWTLGALRKLAESPLSQVSPEEAKVYEGSTEAKYIQHPSLGLFRAQVILFALLQAIERGIPPERLEDLAETAYLEARQMVDWMALQGIDLNPLSDLTPEERFAKVLQYIDDLREVMTPDAIDVISRARVTPPIF
jgi:hypothetical protein